MVKLNFENPLNHSNLHSLHLYVLIYMCLEPCIPTTVSQKSFFFFLAMLQVLWALSSPTGDQSWALGSETAEI